MNTWETWRLPPTLLSTITAALSLGLTSKGVGWQRVVAGHAALTVIGLAPPGCDTMKRTFLALNLFRDHGHAAGMNGEAAIPADEH